MEESLECSGLLFFLLLHNFSLKILLVLYCGRSRIFNSKEST
jgi:hypothetical protein